MVDLIYRPSQYDLDDSRPLILRSDYQINTLCPFYNTFRRISGWLENINDVEPIEATQTFIIIDIGKMIINEEVKEILSVLPPDLRETFFVRDNVLTNNLDIMKTRLFSNCFKGRLLVDYNFIFFDYDSIKSIISKIKTTNKIHSHLDDE